MNVYILIIVSLHLLSVMASFYILKKRIEHLEEFIDFSSQMNDRAENKIRCSYHVFKELENQYFEHLEKYHNDEIH